MAFSYEKWIQQAKSRLELLYQQRERINTEITMLERGIDGFTPLVKSQWAGPDASLSGTIRDLFRSAPE